eukprot:6613287-Pyramimonas_sp.AAC.1
MRPELSRCPSAWRRIPGRAASGLMIWIVPVSCAPLWRSHWMQSRSAEQRRWMWSGEIAHSSRSPCCLHM